MPSLGMQGRALLAAEAVPPSLRPRPPSAAWSGRSEISGSGSCRRPVWALVRFWGPSCLALQVRRS